MTDQNSKLKALELTITVIDELHGNVRDKDYETYLSEQKNFFLKTTDKIKQDRNWVIPSVVFVQAHSLVKSYQASMQRMHDIFKDNSHPDYFYRLAVIGGLKDQLWRFAHEHQE